MTNTMTNTKTNQTFARTAGDAPGARPSFLRPKHMPFGAGLAPTGGGVNGTAVSMGAVSMGADAFTATTIVDWIGHAPIVEGSALRIVLDDMGDRPRGAPA